MSDPLDDLPVRMNNSGAISGEKRGLQMLVGTLLLFSIGMEVLSVFYRHDVIIFSTCLVIAFTVLEIYISFFRNTSGYQTTVSIDSEGVKVQVGKTAFQYAWPDISGTRETIEAHSIRNRTVKIRCLEIQRKGDLTEGGYVIRGGEGLDIGRTEELIAAGIKRYG